MQRMRSFFILTAALALCGIAGGCAIAGFGGAMIESYRRSSTRTIDAEYRGLDGKQWAVVITTNRIIQADNPELVPYLTAKITQRLVENQDQINASGFVPAENILAFMYENPRWVAMPRGELAQRLGVERLIFIEVLEYRLNDPGNQYLWSGLATGTLGVVEADSPLPDEFAFERSIRVAFPDKAGMGPTDFPAQVVATILTGRFIDRGTWPFYTHEEPYYPTY
jgi:hypothetical protein